MSSNYDKHSGEDCCDYVMEKECCDHEPVVAYVNGILGIGDASVLAGSTTRIPFTNILFRTPGVEIPPDGGVTVLEDGEYFISFNAQYAPSDANVSFSIYAPELIGTASLPFAVPGVGAVTFSKLVHLRRGDTVYVIVNPRVDLSSLGAVLSVSKTHE
ncbi:hypothetical protein C2I27_04610 [Priestia megaterium]|uniref:hypothetical protein n=1 Tax=Priestia TaxID=2800373 RepID=UPI000D5151CF|nr:hypothetical protein [Priestia megaterium]PVC73792.1 hypothetical protein C2I27_04610 [Priestia megaterium]